MNAVKVSLQVVDLIKIAVGKKEDGRFTTSEEKAMNRGRVGRVDWDCWIVFSLHATRREERR